LIATLCLSAVQTCEHHNARDGSAHHAHPPYSATEAGSHLLGQCIVETIQIGKCCYHTLATAIACHKILYGTLYSLIYLLICHHLLFRVAKIQKKGE
jgi:hypothetical protein